MKPTRIDLPRAFFWIALTFMVVIVSMGYGMLAIKRNLPPAPQLRAAYSALFVEKAFTASHASKHLQPARSDASGVTVNNTPDDGALVMIVGFFDGENQARLVQRNGQPVRKWSLDYLAHYPDAATRPCARSNSLLLDVHGAIVTPEGDLVFNYEYCGTVKLDKCGNIAWTQNNFGHHSLIPAEAGGYLLLDRRKWRAHEDPDRFPPFSRPATDTLLQEDFVVRIGPDGQVLEEVSIPKMLYDSGLEAVLTANGQDFKSTGPARAELVHANKVAELTSDIADKFALFEAGDWAISMRKLNLVIVVDGTSHRVKWHQTGPWLRQHDTEFRPDGRISVFNNNTYLNAYDTADRVRQRAERSTNIIAIDPVSRKTEVLFGSKPGQEMLAVVRGQHETLANGNLLITEFDGGRVLETSPAGQIVWEYINRFDPGNVGELTNAKLYPAEYFVTPWEPCP